MLAWTGSGVGASSGNALQALVMLVVAIGLGGLALWLRYTPPTGYRLEADGLVIERRVGSTRISGLVERHVGLHFAFDFEVGTGLAQQLESLPHFAAGGGGTCAEVGGGDQRHFRDDAEVAHLLRGAGGFFGDFFGAGILGDEGVADEHRAVVEDQ